MDKRKQEERLRATEKEIETIVAESNKIMFQKNKERSDAWRYVGLLGSFLEVRTMYFRLRGCIWNSEIPDPESDPEAYDHWAMETKNALQDLRNYTILAELSLKEGNFGGIGDERELDEEQLRKLQT